uniref:Uncharacterized protein n=1 Tax=Setaria italica TaxID=4555 RepID=K4AP42_SETIT
MGLWYVVPSFSFQELLSCKAVSPVLIAQSFLKK